MSKNFLLTLSFIAILSILIFIFPDFFSKGFDYVTKENEAILYKYLFVIYTILAGVIALLKGFKKTKKTDTQLSNATLDIDKTKTSTFQHILQIAFGILFLPFCLLFIFASIVLTVDSPLSLLQFLLGSAALLGSIWLTVLTVRLIVNIRITTPLDKRLPSWALILFSLYFLVIPIISVFSGTFFDTIERNQRMLSIFLISAIGAYNLAMKKRGS